VDLMIIISVRAAWLVVRGQGLTAGSLFVARADTAGSRTGGSASLGGRHSRAAQGPTPEMRSTVMRVMYPGGGLSMGGKRTPGPR
jgi:hypothetical protein